MQCIPVDDFSRKMTSIFVILISLVMIPGKLGVKRQQGTYLSREIIIVINKN